MAVTEAYASQLRVVMAALFLFIRVLAGSLDFPPIFILGNQCFILSFQRTQLPNVKDFCFPKKVQKNCHGLNCRTLWLSLFLHK